MLLIDTDNGLGSPSGDIDDGFAVAAFILSRIRIAAMTTVDGNTTEELSFRNTSHISHLLGWTGPVVRAAAAPEIMRTFTGRVAALGPLSNVVHATKAAEVVMVGGTLRTPGRWPPLWPYEFNLTKDREATLAVFESGVPLTIFPIDVARHMWVREHELDAIPGPFGEYARKEARRWFRHLLWLRQTRRFPIYDLPAAFYLIGTDALTMEDTVATMRPNTFIEFGRGSRGVRVCTALRRELLWEQFLRLFA